MAALSPVSRRELVKRLRKLGFAGPFAGGKHLFMVKEGRRLAIPNPHRKEISSALLSRLLKQAGIERDVWMETFSPRNKQGRLCGSVIALLFGFLTTNVFADGRCIEGETLRFGFYGYFDPLSYAANEAPAHPDFNTHLGYEADLVTALERLDDAGLKFSRHGIVLWPDIWLRSVSEFDVVGGGITILEDRTKNDAGETVVRFTNGHVAFRQSLLVRAADAARFPNHAALTRAVRVGVLAGTTGEARLLQLTGLVDGDGNLAAGIRVTTASGEVVADGSARFRITASGSTDNLEGRQRLSPASDDKPTVIYLGDLAGERELLDALAAGTIDAVARGEIGNRDASAESGGRYVVTAIDPQAEYGGFTVNASRTDLLACLNERIAWLTDGGVIGYGQWRENPQIFAERADLWNELQRYRTFFRGWRWLLPQLSDAEAQ